MDLIWNLRLMSEVRGSTLLTLLSTLEENPESGIINLVCPIANRAQEERTSHTVCPTTPGNLSYLCPLHPHLG